jgi:hypothetical protein
VLKRSAEDLCGVVRCGKRTYLLLLGPPLVSAVGSVPSSLLFDVQLGKESAVSSTRRPLRLRRRISQATGSLLLRPSCLVTFVCYILLQRNATPAAPNKTRERGLGNLLSHAFFLAKHKYKHATVTVIHTRLPFQPTQTLGRC